ncbi:hypothetical protein OG592_02135 [Streptomyces avidinii]|uniref:hypothetical protein n=1 Tax=Streptomyces avidinii TaxID=1895 RepID=UPI0038656BD6|nr:hypothetical protein OG592_02135 [Streptomyces avidinii]
MPTPLVPEELQAADVLWAQVEAGLIRLPLSSAHLVETVHAGNKERRRHLAQAMLDAYGGWHMVNPLVVRRQELISALGGGRALEAADVFTSAAGSPFSTYEPVVSECGDQGGEQRVLDGAVWRVVWSELLRDEALPAGELEATGSVIARWAAVHDGLAQYLRENPARRDLRLVTAALMVGEIKLDLARAALASQISEERLGTLLRPETVVGFFAGLPFLGRVLEVTHARLRNPADQWVNNDLNDPYFLACAAGYADYVVAEKKTGHLLPAAARSLPAPRARIHRNLHSLLRDLSSGDNS